MFLFHLFHSKKMFTGTGAGFSISPVSWSNGNNITGETIAPTGQPASEFLNDVITKELLSQPDELSALGYAKEKAKTSPEWEEFYIKLLAEKENTQEARDWYENYNKHYYKNQYESLKEAGLNPWLALQNFGSTGTGSVQSAGVPSQGVSDAITAKKKATYDNLASVAKVIGVATALVGALLIAL